MKKFLLAGLFAVLFCVNHTMAQDAFDMQSRVYKNALKYYDLQAATVALYNMIALKPERADLNDSLAYLYFAGERYAQSYLLGEEILKANPNRMDILELVAVSKQNLGLIKESLADYEKLYAAEKTLFYLYQMSTLQYQLKRYGECVASLDMIIADPKSAEQKVSISVQNGSQEVPMKAAALNVKGICAMELNQPEAAKDNFSKALDAYPQFALARNNMDMLAKKQAEAKPAAAPKPTTTTTAPKKP
jgi:tetratricopeptide (TPR) repeat protein